MAERMRAIQFCACSRRPCRSSRPTTASGIRMMSGSVRVLMTPVPIAVRILSIGIDAAKPVAMAATATTSIGLNRRMNPAMMTTTPISGHRFTAVSMWNFPPSCCEKKPRANHRAGQVSGAGAHSDALAAEPVPDAPRERQRMRAVAVQADGLRANRDPHAVDGLDTLFAHHGKCLR